MPSDVPSCADRLLGKRLREVGFGEVSDLRPKLWHRAGLIPAPIPTRPATPGSGSAYPSEAFEQARALATILRCHRSYDHAAILLFLDGYPVTDCALRNAALRLFDRIDTYIKRAANGATDPETKARRAAEVIVRGVVHEPGSQALRKAQISNAGHRRLIAAWTRIHLVYLGAYTSTGGLIASMNDLGLNTRQFVPGDADWAAIQRKLDAQLVQVATHGGLGNVARRRIPRATSADFSNWVDGASIALLTLHQAGYALDPPGFARDMYRALLDRAGRLCSADAD
jgi:hypothetical protein